MQTQAATTIKDHIPLYYMQAIRDVQYCFAMVDVEDRGQQSGGGVLSY